MKFVINTQCIKNLNDIFLNNVPWMGKVEYTLWLDRNIRQNVKNECLWASCISGTLKNDFLFKNNPITV